MVYKLTDQDGKTGHGYNLMTWAEGTKHKAIGKPGQDLCSDGWLHAYACPNLAILLNPIHANLPNPRLWLAKGKIGKQDGLKVGCRSLTIIKEIPVPIISTEQRLRFALLCALKIYPLWEKYDVGRKWKNWADKPDDAARAAARDAARAAAYAARAAADDAAARAAADAAAYAADAADAAGAAARAAADAADAAGAAARAAAYAAYAARAACAARAAAYAARAADDAAYKDFDLKAIAKEALGL